MKIKVLAADRMDPAEIFRNPDTVFMFADTQMSLKHMRLADGCVRVVVTPLAQAFDENASARMIAFDFSETPADRLEYEFGYIFGRFPRVVDCHQSFLNVNWIVGTDEFGRYDALRTRRGVLIVNWGVKARRIYSPFHRLPWLETAPSTWTKDDLVRALHNGQYEAVKRKVYTQDPSGEVFVEEEPFDAQEMVRRIVESLHVHWNISQPTPTDSRILLYGSRVKDGKPVPGPKYPQESFEIVPEIL